MSDTAEIIESFKEMDIKGISQQLKNTTQAIENFLQGKESIILSATLNPRPSISITP
jgi:hypothetical protein